MDKKQQGWEKVTKWSNNVITKPKEDEPIVNNNFPEASKTSKNAKKEDDPIVNNNYPEASKISKDVDELEDSEKQRKATTKSNKTPETSPQKIPVVEQPVRIDNLVILKFAEYRFSLF